MQSFHKVLSKIKIPLFFGVSLIFLVVSCSDKQGRPGTAKISESTYQKYWCATNNGAIEKILKDGSRCDCITSEHAVEVDFARKWAEAIGQSLHYARLTGKKAGIVLIVNKVRDKKNYQRLVNTIAEYNLPIEVWTINAEQLVQHKEST